MAAPQRSHQSRYRADEVRSLSSSNNNNISLRGVNYRYPTNPSPFDNNNVDNNNNNNTSGPVLVDVLFDQLYTDDITEIKKGFRTLHTLVHCTDRNSNIYERIIYLGGLNIIASTMRKWKENAIILAYGCNVIHQCLLKAGVHDDNNEDNNHLKILVDHFHYYDILFDAMKEHGTVSFVQMNLLSHLVTLAKQSRGFVEYLIAKDAANEHYDEYIFTVMDQYAGNNHIQTLGCQYFTALAEHSVRMRSLINSTKVRTMIGHGLLRFNDHDDQEYRKEACKTLGYYKD